MSEPTLYLVAIAGAWALSLWAGNHIFGPFPTQYRQFERTPDDLIAALEAASAAVVQFGVAANQAVQQIAEDLIPVCEELKRRYGHCEECGMIFCEHKGAE